MNSGIYIILNHKNGHAYWGQAMNLNHRKSQHFSHLQKNKHPNIHIQRAYNLYGKENFRFYTIEYCTIDKLNEREQYYLDQHFGKEYCYNLYPVANSPKGIKFSLERRNKISKSLLGNKRSLGFKQSKETINKKREAQLGRKRSEESKKNMSKAQLGRKHSPQTIEKMKNKIVSQKTKDKIANTKLQTEYKLLSPDGKIIEGKNVSKFCRDNKLNKRGIQLLINDKRNNYKGWSKYCGF